MARKIKKPVIELEYKFERNQKSKIAKTYQIFIKDEELKTNESSCRHLCQSIFETAKK
jgi:hypothetical protein